MHLCYIDESGTPEIPGNTSHFVLAGLAIPIDKWKKCDEDIETAKKRFALADAEIHTSWILRPYKEQNDIPDFVKLNHAQRREAVRRLRADELRRLKKIENVSLYKQTKKNYSKTDAYIHLTHEERIKLINDIAHSISGWEFARLFAECIDKDFFDPAKSKMGVVEQGFEQLVTRFQLFLKNTPDPRPYGILVHDHNPTISKKHTDLMKNFHKSGTLWTGISNIIETPFFVDSQLTSMVQMADLCGYALRKYLENKKQPLFDLILERADRRGSVMVGVRHFTKKECRCIICDFHRKER